MFKEAKAPEAAAQAREPPRVSPRAGVSAATPPGASWERNAQGWLQAAYQFLLGICFSRGPLFFLHVTELSKLFNSPYIGRRPPRVFSLVPFLWKVSPFPQRIKGNWREREENQGSRAAVIPCFILEVQWAIFPLPTGHGKPWAAGMRSLKERSRACSTLCTANQARAARGGHSAGGRGKGDSPAAQIRSLNNIFLQIT